VLFSALAPAARVMWWRPLRRAAAKGVVSRRVVAAVILVGAVAGGTVTYVGTTAGRSSATTAGPAHAVTISGHDPTSSAAARGSTSTTTAPAPGDPSSTPTSSGATSTATSLPATPASPVADRGAGPGSTPARPGLLAPVTSTLSGIVTHVIHSLPHVTLPTIQLNLSSSTVHVGLLGSFSLTPPSAAPQLTWNVSDLGSFHVAVSGGSGDATTGLPSGLLSGHVAVCPGAHVASLCLFSAGSTAHYSLSVLDANGAVVESRSVTLTAEQ
jgi:hypothetical protein